jgi:hypothetical protein
VFRSLRSLRDARVKLTRVYGADLIALARGCPLLERINVTYSNVTSASLLVVSECCPGCGS